MSREEFIATLERMIETRRITEEEAARALAIFDDVGWPEESATPEDEDSRDLRWIIVIFGLLGPPTANARRNAALERKQRQMRDALRRRFEEGIVEAADRLQRGGTIPQWRRSMQALAGDYFGQMAMIGKHGAITQADREAIRLILRGQETTIRSFAAEIFARQSAGRPFSALYIANRARGYGAPAWSAYYMGMEEGAEAGYVILYDAVDDDHTCQPCHSFNGRYFLPGAGPYPGDICAGGGACRCQRIMIFDPAIYARLTGGEEV